MTIVIESWQQASIVIAAAIFVLGVVASLHWTLFAVPLLKKIFSPYRERLEVLSRVARDKYPEEYEKAELDVISDRMIKGSI